METFTWSCNLCNSENSTPSGELHREGGRCLGCQSSVRDREIKNVLEAHLERLNPEFALAVIGMSDAKPLSDNLSSDSRLLYRNTYLDEAPLLDILDIDDSYLESADVLISSDVLEHVPYPPLRSIEGIHKILRTNGLLILTVPWSKDYPYVEHYPWLVSYTVQKNNDGTFTTTGIDRFGESKLILNPIFHGGPGNTLEMRFFHLDVVLDLLKKAGFREMRVHEHDVLDSGIRRDNGRIGTIAAYK